jgi:hypothetical protein
MTRSPQSYLLASWKARHRQVKRARSSYKKARQKIIGSLFGKHYDPAEYFVDSKHKLVYIVNAKAGCSAIKKSILESMGHDREATHYSDIHQLGYDLGLSVNHLTGEKKGYYFFSFVRDPFQRLASLYFNKFCDQQSIVAHGFEYRRYLGGILQRDDSFTDFIRKVVEIPDILCDRHFKPQHYLLYEEAPKVDYVGKLEMIDSEYSRLVENYGLQRLQAVNQSPSYSITDFYDAETLRLVARRYASDIESFGYQDAYDKLKAGIGA